MIVVKIYSFGFWSLSAKNYCTGYTIYLVHFRIVYIHIESERKVLMLCVVFIVSNYFEDY
jgi:hypothetical protein